MPGDNFRREVKKLKRDASSLSGGIGECPFCAQPFLSIEHKRASIKRDHERAAGGLDAFLAKLEEMARNRDDAELRAAEREGERYTLAGQMQRERDETADEPAQLGRALREVRRG